MSSEPIRALDSTNTAQAAAANSDLVVVGNPDAWQLLYKQANTAMGQMFSVKQCGRVLQFTWKDNQSVNQICESLVFLSSGYASPLGTVHDVIDSPTVRVVKDDFGIKLQCAAKSRSADFDKRTYLVSTLHGMALLALTREKDCIAMSACQYC